MTIGIKVCGVFFRKCTVYHEFSFSGSDLRVRMVKQVKLTI